MKRVDYSPGPASLARVDKNGDNWTLIVERELRHPPELVWKALTDPTQLREWAPFDVDRNLASVGPVTLTTVGPAMTAASNVTRAEAPRLLEYTWGDKELRWRLEPNAGGTRLTLWHNIDRGFIAMGAAGWHICLDVLAHFLGGDPLGRIVAGDALQLPGWHRLNAEYSQQFGIKTVTPNFQQGEKQ